MEQVVIKRLRIKFIAINMTLAFLVLLITFGTVCALNHANSVNTINSQLSYVLTRAAASLSHPSDQVQGVKPLAQPDIERADISLIRETTPFGEDAFEADEEAGASNQSSASDRAASDSVSASAATEEGTSNASAPATSASVAPPVIGSGQGSTTLLTAVFKVTESGIYTTIPAYTTATIPENILLRADDTVLNSPNTRGYLAEYDLMYEKLHQDDAWIIAYANASSTHAWRQLAVLLVIVGLIALIVFFLINILFSQWATRPVAASIRQQQQFTADASHELKTPLTVILANLSILRSHADSTVAEQMQWVESSETEAQRMQLLVNDMLSLARPQSGSTSAPAVRQEPVDLTDLVEGEVLQFESVAFERGILLDSRIQEDIQVRGDAEKLGRMVSTLIDNACKYVETNGLVEITLEVDASSAVADPDARLRVHNTGDPIPPDELMHVFDRFYRADKARTGGKGGYGLGLAIGQQIAHEHNGEITVTSSADTGTTFTVTLPLYEP